MPKAPGSGSMWTKIKSIKDFKEKYTANNIEKALVNIGLTEIIEEV